jgi:hypothetical protein
MCQAFQATVARYPHELALRTVEGGGDGHVRDRRRVRCWLICGRSCSGAGGMSGSAAAGGGCWPAAAPLPPCRSEPGSDERGDRAVLPAGRAGTGRRTHASADRVLWTAGNGSSHHRADSVTQLAWAWPNGHPIRLPAHASWLAWPKSAFPSSSATPSTPTTSPAWTRSATRLAAFQTHYNEIARR